MSASSDSTTGLHETPLVLLLSEWYPLSLLDPLTRAIVPKASVQKFTGTLTTPTSLTSAKLKEWTSTVAELKRYLQNVHAVQGLPAMGFPQAVHVDPPTSSPVASNGVVRKVGIICSL